jgi:hypothetical protein
MRTGGSLVADQAENHKIMQSGNPDERKKAIEEIRRTIAILPDENKKQAWEDLIHLTQHKNRRLRRFALESIAIVFHYTTDKIKAQNDLSRLIEDEDIDVRWGATKSLSSIFSDIPDKGQAWKDLIRLAKDKYNLEDSEIKVNILRLLKWGQGVSNTLPFKGPSWRGQGTPNSLL